MSKRQLLRSASVITLATLISRICGYLRDQRVALLLGTSPAADSFILAYRIPNLVRRLTAEGALGASFIPVFARSAREEGREPALHLARILFWELGLVLAAIAITGTLASRQIVAIFTLLGGPAHWDLAARLNHVIFPSVLFVGLAALASATLNGFSVFGLPAATPIFFNLTIIAFSTAAVYGPFLRWAPAGYRTPAAALAAGVLAGSFIQFAMQVPALLRRGMSFRPAFAWRHPAARKVLRLMSAGFIGIGVYQINFFVDTIFATSRRMPAGSVASLYLADRVMQLALGSYAIAFSTALLPALSHQAAEGKFAEMKSTLGFAIRLVSFVTIPAALGLILLRQPVIQVLFEHGQFSAGSTRLTAHALLYYSLGLPAFAAVKLITPMYYSLQDTMTPARLAAGALGLNVVLNIIFLLAFSRWLSNASPALASTLAAYFNFAALFLVFRGRYGRLGGRGLAGAILRMAACACAMGIAVAAMLRFAAPAVWGPWLARAGVLALLILVAAGVYFAAAWALRCKELSEIFLLLRRREAGAALEAGG